MGYFSSLRHALEGLESHDFANLITGEQALWLDSIKALIQFFCVGSTR